MKKNVIENMLKVIMKNDTDFLSGQDIINMGIDYYYRPDDKEIKEICLDKIADLLSKISSDD